MDVNWVTLQNLLKIHQLSQKQYLKDIKDLTTKYDSLLSKYLGYIHDLHSKYNNIQEINIITDPTLAFRGNTYQYEEILKELLSSSDDLAFLINTVDVNDSRAQNFYSEIIFGLLETPANPSSKLVQIFQRLIIQVVQECNSPWEILGPLPWLSLFQIIGNRLEMRRYLEKVLSKPLRQYCEKYPEGLTMEIFESRHNSDSYFINPMDNLKEEQFDSRRLRKAKTQQSIKFQIQKPQRNSIIESTPSSKYSNEDSIKIIKQSCQEIINSLKSSVNYLPRLVKAIAYTIYTEIINKFGDGCHQDATNIISTLIFSRWIITNMLQADNVGILSDMILDSTIHTNIIHLSKLLQRISVTKVISGDDADQINPFIQEMSGLIEQFISEVVSVGSSTCKEIDSECHISLITIGSLNLITQTIAHQQLFKGKKNSILLRYSRECEDQRSIASHNDNINNDSVIMFKLTDFDDYVRDQQLSERDPMEFVDKIKDTVMNALTLANNLDTYDAFCEDKPLDQVMRFIVDYHIFNQQAYISKDKIEPSIHVAHFIASFLPALPEEYTRNNYFQLFNELMQLVENKSRQITTMQSDIKYQFALSIQEVENENRKLQKELKTLHKINLLQLFHRTIKEIQIPICISTVNQITIQLRKQELCKHKRIDHIESLVRGNLHRSMGKGVVQKIKGHTDKIADFPKEFGENPLVAQCLASFEDHFEVSSSFCEYLDMILQQLKNTEFKRDFLQDLIENYLSSKLYAYIITPNPLPQDLELHHRALTLDWVDFCHMDIKMKYRNAEMINLAVNSLKEIEKKRTPKDKVQCMVNCYYVISNLCTFFSRKESCIGADDSVPLIILTVIKSQIRKLATDINYIQKFRNKKKMLGLEGFAYQNIQSAATFILQVDHTQLMNVTKEEFMDNCKRSAIKHNLPY